MILLDQVPETQTPAEITPSFKTDADMNVGNAERAVSVAAGSLLTLQGLRRRSIPGMLTAAVGALLIHRGATGRCNAYKALSIDTRHASEQSYEEEITDAGIHVEQAFLINRTPEYLYNFWKNLENLPSFMHHVHSIKCEGNRSHWVVQAPKIAGGEISWDAEITADEPNQRIAWRSLPGSSVDTAGEIRFSKAPGDRGTEVHVSMGYVPPGGILGHWLATAFGLAPRRQMRDDLGNFKRLMELGEIPTIEGQPRGTCLTEGGTREQFQA